MLRGKGLGASLDMEPRKALQGNAAVLCHTAAVWVGVFDYEAAGCPRTPPLSAVKTQAASAQTNSDWRCNVSIKLGSLNRYPRCNGMLHSFPPPQTRAFWQQNPNKSFLCLKPLYPLWVAFQASH